MQIPANARARRDIDKDAVAILRTDLDVRTVTGLREEGQYALRPIKPVAHIGMIGQRASRALQVVAGPRRQAGYWRAPCRHAAIAWRRLRYAERHRAKRFAHRLQRAARKCSAGQHRDREPDSRRYPASLISIAVLIALCRRRSSNRFLSEFDARTQASEIGRNECARAYAKHRGPSRTNNEHESDRSRPQQGAEADFTPLTQEGRGSLSVPVFAALFRMVQEWRSLGDSNPCFRRERATS